MTLMPTTANPPSDPEPQTRIESAPPPPITVDEIADFFRANEVDMDEFDAFMGTLQITQENPSDEELARGDPRFVHIARLIMFCTRNLSRPADGSTGPPPSVQLTLQAEPENTGS